MNKKLLFQQVLAIVAKSEFELETDSLRLFKNMVF